MLDFTALNDQHYGGLIIWLPGTLTSFAAMIVVLVTMRLNEEKGRNVKRLSVAMLVDDDARAAQAAPFEITDGWFRALPGKLPAGGYFTAYNGTGRDVSIMGANSDACGMLMIHQSSNKGGMSGMDMVDRVTVPANGTVRFAPRGYHLMCENPNAKMKIGAESRRAAETVGRKFRRRGLCGEKRGRPKLPVSAPSSSLSSV